MGSNTELLQFLEKCTELRDTDQNSDHDAATKRLRQALIQKMPLITRRIQAVPQSDWSLNDYLSRLYRRLKRRSSTTDDFDHAIDAGVSSLLHENTRNREKRFRRTQPINGATAETIADPSALQFMTALVSRDQLRIFLELLDPWTKTAFYRVYMPGDAVPRAEIARRMGMRENSFNRRFQRGMEKARCRYREVYGPY